MEPENCDKLKQNEVLWNKMVKGTQVTYVEGKKAYNPTLSKQFTQSWDESEVQLGGVKFIVSMQTIAATTSLVVEGMTFPKKLKGTYKEDFNRFLKLGEMVAYL